MFNAISWQQYITAVLLFTASWYAYVGLRFYRPTIKSPSIVPPVANKLTVVMGEAKPEADTGLYQPEELLFSSIEPDDISNQTLPRGPSDDLLAEASVLVSACKDKTEFLSFFNLLLDKYEVFADEISLPAIIKSLNTNKLPFQIQAAEWPQTFAS